MPVPYNAWLATLTRKAELRAKAGLSRSAAARPTAIDLAGNDYLGLSRHPRVLAAAAAALAEHGLGATGSRLVRGTSELHLELESVLAQWIGSPSALVYSSGYLANLGAIRALAGLSPRTLLISDAHCHASMIDGCRISGASVAVFNHGDAAHAASLIDPSRPCVILTESVFSVDGDLAPLSLLHAAARSGGALLLVDDAHGLGVTTHTAMSHPTCSHDASSDGLGIATHVAAAPSSSHAAVSRAASHAASSQRLGVASHAAASCAACSDLASLAAEPDVIVTATLSKALGGAGGVVAGPAEFIRHLIDTSRTFIFDTAPPPAVVAGVLAAVDIARSSTGDSLRMELHRRAAMLAALPGASGSSGGSAAPAGGVVALDVGDAAEAVEWANRCREKGVAVGCFRPPSTPDSRSRLRLTVNAGVPVDEFERAIEVIEACRP